METILENMGYELEDEEVEDLRNHLPTEGEHVIVPLGKLSFSKETSICFHMEKSIISVINT